MDDVSSLIYTGFIWKYLLGKLSTVFENDASEYDAGGTGWQVGGFQTDDIQVGIVSGKSGDWKNQRDLCVV